MIQQAKLLISYLILPRNSYNFQSYSDKNHKSLSTLGRNHRHRTYTIACCMFLLPIHFCKSVSFGRLPSTTWKKAKPNWDWEAAVIQSRTLMNRAAEGAVVEESSASRSLHSCCARMNQNRSHLHTRFEIGCYLEVLKYLRPTEPHRFAPRVLGYDIDMMIHLVSTSCHIFLVPSCLSLRLPAHPSPHRLGLGLLRYPRKAGG